MPRRTVSREPEHRPGRQIHRRDSLALQRNQLYASRLSGATYGGKRVLVVECAAGRSAVFVKDGAAERFFVRSGVTTLELPGSQAQEYASQRFSTV
jgi:hypothetical protein